MLKTYNDISIAEYLTLADLSEKEVSQADFVIVKEKVPGGVYHSESSKWWGSLKGIDSPEKMIRSKKERKASKQTREWFKEKNYEIKTVLMTEQLYLEFQELYNSTTMVRQRPLRFNLESSILGKLRVGVPVYLAGLFQEETLVAGLVFSVTKNQAVVSFGAKPKFKEVRGGIGGVLELELIQYCLENNLDSIVHGRSANPAGIFGSAGIFEFKTRYGFSAYPDGVWQTMFIQNIDARLSNLVFVTMVDGEVGTLILSDDDPAKAIKKYKSSRTKTASVISLSEAAERFRYRV